MSSAKGLTARILSPALALLLLSVACSAPEAPVPDTAQPAPSPAAAAPETADGPAETRMLAHMRYLAVELGPRDLESGGERRAALYLADTLRGLGYATTVQEFPITRYDPASQVGLLAPESRDLRALPLEGSPQGDVSGPLVDVGLGTASDVAASPPEGKVALIQRGQISFQEKVDNAAAAGAVAAVIHNNEAGIFRGVLPQGAQAPVLGVSQREGEALRELLQSGPVDLRVLVRRFTVMSQNVIAEKPGASGPIVVVSAHYDSVPGTQGASDNASGTAIVLTLAEELVDSALPYTLRFIGFGGEEVGLLGSRHYLSTLPPGEQERIAAVLNFDAVAGAPPLEVAGDSALAAQVQAFDEAVVFAALPPGVASDHVPFLRADIPAVTLSTAGMSLIHTSRDNMENARTEPTVRALRLAMQYLAGLSF